MAWVMFWKARTIEVDLVPLLVLDGEEELHEVGADGEVGGVAGDDEGFEVGDLLAGGLEGLGDEGDDVVAEGVHLGVQFDGGDAVAEVDDGGSGVLLDDAVGLFDDGERGDAFGDGDGLVGAGDGVEVVAAAGDGGVVFVPGLRLTARSFSTLAAMGAPAARIFSVVARTPAASNISKGPSSQLKPVRMAVSISTMLSAICWGCGWRRR